MFSFQAIHNGLLDGWLNRSVVIYQCQCSLFKQFTTQANDFFVPAELSFISVNVLFSSNSQPDNMHNILYLGCHLSVSMFSFQAIHNRTRHKYHNYHVVIYQCQCSLFKQFTTYFRIITWQGKLSFISVNVLFSSNSQPVRRERVDDDVVIYQCQCSLFKQFTTDDE